MHWQPAAWCAHLPFFALASCRVASNRVARATARVASNRVARATARVASRRARARATARVASNRVARATRRACPSESGKQQSCKGDTKSGTETGKQRCSRTLLDSRQVLTSGFQQIARVRKTRACPVGPVDLQVFASRQAPWRPRQQTPHWRWR